MEEPQEWIADLRKAVEANSDSATVRSATRGRIVPDSLRSRFWKACLIGGSAASADEVSDVFSNVYDLEEQADIRAECRKIAESLCSDADSINDRVFIQSDLESVLTQYCKATKRRFDFRDEWHLILHVIWTVETNKKSAYRIFVAFLSRFLPKDGTSTVAWASLFRLLLLYHEPELCNFLDTKRLLPESYAMRWFCSLFASSCDINVARSLWDVYIYHDDPYLVFFLALVLLINAKDEILTNRGASKEELIKMIDSYAHQVTVDDLEDFCTLALHYAAQTPSSFRRLLASQLFREVPRALASAETNLGPTSPKTGAIKQDFRLEELLCLPVLCTDVLNISTLQMAANSGMQYLFIDCRPDDQCQYSGSLPGAFRLNAVLMIQNPVEFNERMNELLARLDEAAANAEQEGQDEEDSERQSRLHVCFCSSGFTVEDSYANMLIANCLQRKIRYVSALIAGFRSIHDAPSLQRAKLENHDDRWCIYCHPPAEPRGAADSDADDEENDTASPKRNRNTANASAKAVESTDSTPATPNSTSLFGRLSGIVKQKIGSKTDQLVSKGAELTQRVAETGKSVLLSAAIKNNLASPSPTDSVKGSVAGSGASSASKPRAKKPSAGAPYRNAGSNVFSIADDENDEDRESFDEDDEESAGRRSDSAVKREVVNLDLWLRNKPDVRHSFPCHILRENGFLVDAHLLVTDAHLYVLRHLTPPVSTVKLLAGAGASTAQMAVIHSRRPLANVVKITSKRKIPELITFQYGVFVDATDPNEEGQVRIVGCDRLLIPKAGDAIRLIKQLIVGLSNGAEPESAAPSSATAATAAAPVNSNAIAEVTESASG